MTWSALVFGISLLAAAQAAPATAAGPGIEVYVNGTTEVLVSDLEMYDYADRRDTGLDPYLSAKRLVELVGVAPSALDAANAIVIEPAVENAQNNGASPPVVYTQTQVIFGVDPPHDLGFFANLETDDGAAKTVEFFVYPFVDTDGNLTTRSYLSEGPLHAPYPVSLTVGGAVLGVPQPVDDLANPAAAQTVQFSDPGSVSSDTFTPGAAPDTNGLLYSWDFGDGSPPSPPSPQSAATHAYAASGKYDALVTVTDAAGNAGVSPFGVIVPVGPQATPGAPPIGNANGPTVPGGPPGKSPPGKTTNALPTGPVNGSVNARSPTAAPRVTGAAPPSDATASPAAPAATSPGSGRSGGGGGAGGGAGRGGSGGSGAGRAGAGGSGKHAGGTAAAAGAADAGLQGAGAGRLAPPKTLAAYPASAASGLTGVLVESLGSPLPGDPQSGSEGALALLQSVARGSSGGGGTGGLPAWLLGILAVVALLVAGVVREAGERGLRRWRQWARSGWRAVAS